MTAPRIEPKDPRAAAAKAALHRLVEHPSPDTDPATKADRTLLASIGRDVDALVNRWHRLRRCPACERFGVLVLWGPEHVLACPEHPAVLRLARAEATWRAVSATAQALGQPVRLSVELPPRPAWPPEATYPNRARAGGMAPVTDYVLDFEVSASLLAVGTVAGRAKEKDLPARTRSLEILIEEWGHYQDRAAVPQACPCCGDLHDIQSLPAHIVLCSAHPDLRRAEALERGTAALIGDTDPGVGDLVAELQRHRGTLKVLIEACWTVHDALGYLEHGRSYLRETDERTFEKAVRAAVASLEGRAEEAG